MTNANISTTTTPATLREQIAVSRALAELQALAKTHPEWFARLEDAALDCAPRSELVDLLSDAPTAAARQYVLSKFMTRMSLAALTGRAFL